MIFVVDRSGSMSSIRRKVVSVFNSQLAALKKVRPVPVRRPSSASTPSTPSSMRRAFCSADRQGAKARRHLDYWGDGAARCDGPGAGRSSGSAGGALDNVSFILLVLTDGYENHSRKYKSKIGTMIKAAQASGRWTLAFLTPKGGEATLLRYGIPAGNIQAWSTSGSGVQTMGQDLQRGLQTFYEARQKGERARWSACSPPTWRRSRSKRSAPA